MTAQPLLVAQAGARRTRLWLAIVLFTCARLLAEPYGLNYQARITDPFTGTPRSGVFTVTFRLYDVPEGGAPLWWESRDYTIFGGLLSTRLGELALLPSAIFDGRDLWLGVQVGADAEALPRQYLAPVAHAMRAAIAGDAERVGGLEASELAPASHTHDAAALASGALDDARIPETIARSAEVAPLIHEHDGRYVPLLGPAEITSVDEVATLTVRQFGNDIAGLFTAGIGHGIVGSTAGSGNGVAGVSGNTGSWAHTFLNFMGVRGDSEDGYGVGGASLYSHGVFGASVHGTGIRGTGGLRGVQGDSSAVDADGVTGVSSATAGVGAGVRGESSSATGRGVHGAATALAGINYGVYGKSDSVSGQGVHGAATATTGINYGVFGQSDSVSGQGVHGVATATSGNVYGVYGSTPSFDGTGVCGYASTVTGTAFGVRGETSSRAGVGVRGKTSATGGTTYGVQGISSSTENGAGVRGEGPYVGVWGNSTGRWGVYGRSTASQGYGVYGASGGGADNYAGYFSGQVAVTGTLSKGGGAFKIDHPLDPANKYLQHSFVESPDMMNVYNGNVVLDAAGGARVDLPDYFEALNRDFRYQLTAIGGAAPGLHIAREVEDNHFEIAGGTPGLKVSWQVTGVRQDPFAEANRIAVELDKPKDKQGAYLHPEAWGLGQEKGLEPVTDPGAAR